MRHHPMPLPADSCLAAFGMPFTTNEIVATLIVVGITLIATVGAVPAAWAAWQALSSSLGSRRARTTAASIEQPLRGN